MTEPTDRSFEQLVLRYQGVVCAVAYAVLRDRARSEEVAQEAFLIAWQKMPSLAEPPQLPGWLCGIARNLASNAARRRKESAAMEPEPVAPTTPLDDVLDREADDIARGALATLSEADREVVVLYYRSDSTLDEIAAVLGVQPAAVRKRIERARLRLRGAVAVVEATLRATRPGPAFTAGCVAALATGLAVSTAKAEPVPSAAPAHGVPWASVGAVAAIAALTIGMITAVDPPASASSTVATSTTTPRATRDPIAGATQGLRRYRTEAARNARLAISHATSTTAVTATTATATSPAPTTATAGGTEGKTMIYDFSGDTIDGRPAARVPAAAPATVSKGTFRRAIQQVEPMLFECVVAARGHHDGTISATIRVIAEPGNATVVDTVAIAGDAAYVADADLVECFTETLLAIELPPLPDAATIDLVYPFTVRLSDLNR